MYIFGIKVYTVCASCISFEDIPISVPETYRLERYIHHQMRWDIFNIFLTVMTSCFEAVCGAAVLRESGK